MTPARFIVATSMIEIVFPPSPGSVIQRIPLSEMYNCFLSGEKTIS